MSSETSMRSDNKAHLTERKVEEQQVEHREVGAAPPSFGQKFKRHCARRWWVHLIVFCLSFLIISLCLVYVAMPKIAQKGVDDSTLEFTELDFLDPTSESIVLTQRGILHSPSIYTPTLDSFNASLFLVTKGVAASTPMMNIEMPQIHAIHPKSNVSVESQHVQITNLDQVAAYATAVLSNEEVTTRLVGKTRLHEGHLPVLTVNYNSSSTYKGLNGLAGFNVTGARINFSAKAGEPNLSGFAYIPNVSIMTIAMGDVTLSLATASAGIVGNVTIPNMTLAPGNNTLPMAGIINQPLVLSSVDKDGFATLIITGQSAIYNGQHLTYYERALASNVLTLKMNIPQIVKDSTS